MLNDTLRCSGSSEDESGEEMEFEMDLNPTGLSTRLFCSAYAENIAQACQDLQRRTKLQMFQQE